MTKVYRRTTRHNCSAPTVYGDADVIRGSRHLHVTVLEMPYLDTGTGRVGKNCSHGCSVMNLLSRRNSGYEVLRSDGRKRTNDQHECHREMWDRHRLTQSSGFYFTEVNHGPRWVRTCKVPEFWCPMVVHLRTHRPSYSCVDRRPVPTPVPVLRHLSCKKH